jgi:hypothetical protein
MMSEEFVGPFASWADLKRDYLAKGDGISDDTAAIQSAVSDLTATGRPRNLFIPPGTYLVTQTVTLLGGLGAGIIGADPATTTIKWGGAAGGTLLHLDGCAYGRLGRLTLDGGSNTTILVDQNALVGGLPRQFGTGNEYADLVFQNASIGIRAGNASIGEAESSVLRCKFVAMMYGILLRNFNCLDWWTWFCEFYECRIGMSNTLSDTQAIGAGAFHGYGDIFIGSIFADIQIGNTGNFNFRDCYSNGSKQFINEVFYYTNAAQTRVQNCIADSGIYMGNGGPLLITDSMIAGPVTVTSSNGGDLISVGNKYTVLPTASRLRSVDDVVVPSLPLPPTPVLPPAPPLTSRQVFEVPITDDGTLLQAAITQAATLNGSKPVVHIPVGTLALRKPITVPECDVQIIGDGWPNTIIDCGNTPGIGIDIQGRSRVTLSDLHIRNVVDTAITVEDAFFGRVLLQEPIFIAASAAGIFVDGVNSALVELRDFNFENCAVGAQIEGGVASLMAMLAGSADLNATNVSADSANVVVRDMWNDTPTGGTINPVLVSVMGASQVTVEGCVHNMQSAWAVAVSGPAEVLSATLGGAVNYAMFVGGCSFLSAFTTAPYAAGAGTLENRLYDTINGSTPIADAVVATDDQIRAWLAQSRATHPTLLVDLPAGATDVRFARVTIENCKTGIHIKGINMAAIIDPTTLAQLQSVYGQIQSALTQFAAILANATGLPPGKTSPSGTTITGTTQAGGATVTDAAGHVWSLGGSAPYGFVILRDTVPFANGSGVSLTIDKTGIVWTKNNQGNWYVSTSAGWNSSPGNAPPVVA